uniref:Nuclear transport factor 2 family protein n=1 Tax=Haemonchus contortus TaxID=6289 RepID=A0A7I5EDJ6_HAECO
MLVFFLALVLILHNVAAQRDLLPEEAKDTFETLNMLYSDNLEWSYEWAEKALEYLNSPDSVKADLVIKGKQSFPADDTQLLWQKLLAFLEPRFDKKEKALERLPAGTIYGCNGFIDGKGNKDVISAACLYKKP